MKKVKFKLEPGATAPIKATDGSVGYDLFVYGSHCIYPGRNAVRTGLSIQLPEGFEATVRPRSGCSLKGIPDEYNISPVFTGVTEVVDELDDTERGEGGFNSTGV